MNTITLTRYQLGLLHHTLGINPTRREPYRNFFVASPGHHDYANLEALEREGFMEKASSPGFLAKTDVVFRVTQAGQLYALEHLPQPPAPVKRTKYQQYRAGDCGLTFAEWLGIDVPKREYNRYAAYSDPTLGFVRLTSSRATGAYCKTLKEAKESYRAALKKQREKANLNTCAA